MNEDSSFATFLISFMMDVALLAGVPLAVATLFGLIVSFFQAITQIQDQTLGQTIKIVAITGVLLAFGAALAAPLLSSTKTVFETFDEIVR
jgi:type III secretory pathway component EscS